MSVQVLPYLLLVVGLQSISSARILGIFHLPSYSHQQLGSKLMQELASRGHEVTFVTPFAPKTQIKNLNHIQLQFNRKEDQKPNMFEHAHKGIIERIVWLDMMGLMFTDMVLNETNMKSLLNSKKEFDVVIIEQFLSEALRGICYHLNTPCVVMSTVGSSRWTNQQMGNPGNPSYIPDLFLSLSSYMTFWERLYNTIITTSALLFSHLYVFPKQNEILHKYFPNAPHLYDLYYNTSLMLLNSHVSTNAPVPYVPNMIEIGGFHVNPPKELPSDLQDYLNNAKDGVIFFSMGSNLQSKNIDTNKLNSILRVFSKLKQKVLWKWENETLLNQPKNVKLSKWLPQQDVLAHPNIKLFITHGGLLSTIESIYHGVPIVGIPIYGDQEMNIANAEIAGYGIAVPYKELNDNNLEIAVNKVLYDSRYKDNAKRRSKIMNDNPITQSAKAVFWIEYVIRHKGALHLRTAGLALNWYQYILLDVVLFIFGISAILLFLFWKLIMICFGKKKVIITETKKCN